TLAIIAGPAMEKTRAVLISTGYVKVRGALLPARRVDEAHDQPDRNDDDRAEQEIAPQPAHSIEAHVPDIADQPPQAMNDVERVEAERRQDDADQDRYQDQAHQDAERRAAENTGSGVVAHAALHRLQVVGHVV